MERERVEREWREEWRWKGVCMYGGKKNEEKRRTKEIGSECKAIMKKSGRMRKGRQTNKGESARMDGGRWVMGMYEARCMLREQGYVYE